MTSVANECCQCTSTFTRAFYMPSSNFQPGSASSAGLPLLGQRSRAAPGFLAAALHHCANYSIARVVKWYETTVCNCSPFWALSAGMSNWSELTDGRLGALTCQVVCWRPG